MFNVEMLSRHAVGRIGRHGQYVVRVIGLYHKGLCLRIAAKTGDKLLLYGPGICWAFPGHQRVRMALLKMKERTKVKVEDQGIEAKS